MLGGTAFGEYGEGYLRLSYANSEANLNKALERMRPAGRGVEDSEGGFAPLPNLPPRNPLRRQSRRSNLDHLGQPFLRRARRNGAGRIFGARETACLATSEL